jgi:hypothetical protein
VNRIGEGLFLVGLGTAIFLGWWGGLFSSLIEDATGRVRGAAGGAGIPTVTPLTPAERRSILEQIDAARGAS